MIASHLPPIGPGNASPLAAFSVGLGGIIIGVAGCLLVVWLLRTRRHLTYALLADTPLLNKSVDAGELEVRVRGANQPLDDPHVVVIGLRCRSWTDIRPTDFVEGEQSLVIHLGRPIVKVLAVEVQRQDYWPWVQIDERQIATVPELIRARASCKVTVLTAGPPKLSHRGDLAGVRVRLATRRSFWPRVAGRREGSSRLSTDFTRPAA